jgi:4-hydroxybutyrate CoA-transferase
VTVLVKYCGGCNTSYDRVAFVECLQNDFSSVNVVYAPGSDSIPDFVLVVCGCSVKCAADIECHGRYGKMVVAGWQDYKALAEIFRKIALTEKEAGGINAREYASR